MIIPQKIFFFKTHNALLKVHNKEFTTPEFTLGLIYIVRDPRNVITSLKNYYNYNSYEKALDFMMDDANYIWGENNDYAKSQIISSWKINYISWVKKNKYKKILIKYEDMINDPEKTFEKLETFGIPRIAYNSDFMPGFWYEETDFKVDKNFISINDIANYLKILEDYEHQSSVLIFNKVPKEKAIDKNIIQNWIELSIDKAKQLNVTGKDVTPFLISEINSLSQNKSLEANSALIVNNALLAGKIAKKFSLV